MDQDIILNFKDGSHEMIHLKHGEDTCDVFNRVLKSPDSSEAKAIAAAVSISEPDGHMIEAAAAILNSPIETETEKKEILQ